MKLNNSVAIIYTPLQRNVINLITKKIDIDIIDFYEKEAVILGEKIDINFYSLLKLKAKLKQYNEYYIPHNYGVFSNYIINNCKGNINYYYEGVLYIRNQKVNLTRSVIARKQFHSLLLGFIYKPKEILSYEKSNVKKIYIPSEISHIVQGNQKIKYFDYKTYENLNKLDPKSILILGGVGKGLIKELLKIIIKEINDNPQVKFYYKPHPSEKSIDYIVSNNNQNNLTIIKNSKTAEDVILKLAPYKIISLNPSSALLHAKLFNPKIETYYLQTGIDPLIKEKFTSMNILNY